MSHDVPRITFFVDVDDTLVNTVNAKARMDDELTRILGPDGANEFWSAYAEVRSEIGVVDIPRTLARAPAACGASEGGLNVQLADLFMTFPFESCLFPSSLEVLRHLRKIGRVVILSDGDPIYQTAKIARCGISAAVDGFVAVFPHKEEHLLEMRAAYPADHYVLVDDKPRVISAVSRQIGAPLTTVFVRQGRYASEVQPGTWHGADHTVDAISELLLYKATDFVPFDGT